MVRVVLVPDNADRLASLVLQALAEDFQEQVGDIAASRARMKQSGMCWSLRGADAISELRCQDASGRWDQIWPKTRNQTGAA
jgi:hypothetical protein